MARNAKQLPQTKQNENGYVQTGNAQSSVRLVGRLPNDAYRFEMNLRKVHDAATLIGVDLSPYMGAAANLQPGAVVIAGATTPPDYPPKLAARLEELGVLLLDAPVSGGAAKATAGEMTVMASGAPEAFEKAAAVLDAISERVYRLGDAPGQGAVVKMINQLLAGVHIAAMAEAFALASRSGADLETVYEVISNAAGASWMFQNRGPSILEGDYQPKSAVDIFVKDLGIVLDAGRSMTFPLPLAATAHQQFLAASAGGHGRENDSAVIKVFQKLTGIDLPAQSKE